MTSIPQGPTLPAPDRLRFVDYLEIPALWAGLSIITMWLAVLFDAIFGPDFVSTTAGGDSTRIPSAIAVALFAAIASASIGKVAFGRRR